MMFEITQSRVFAVATIFLLTMIIVMPILNELSFPVPGFAPLPPMVAQVLTAFAPSLPISSSIGSWVGVEIGVPLGG